MTIERLYTLKELADRAGMAVSSLREIFARGELAIIRYTPKGNPSVPESASVAWQQAPTEVVEPPPQFKHDVHSSTSSDAGEGPGAWQPRRSPAESLQEGVLTMSDTPRRRREYPVVRLEDLGTVLSLDDLAALMQMSRSSMQKLSTVEHKTGIKGLLVGFPAGGWLRVSLPALAWILTQFLAVRREDLGPRTLLRVGDSAASAE
jgi:hypothetical protein